MLIYFLFKVKLAILHSIVSSVFGPSKSRLDFGFVAFNWDAYKNPNPFQHIFAAIGLDYIGLLVYWHAQQISHCLSI